MSNNERHDQDSSSEGKPGRTRGVLRWIGGAMIPVQAAKSAFRFGRDMTHGSKEKRLAVTQGSYQRISNIFSRAFGAIVRPPTWDSIEEMEEGWGVDDDNREQVVGGMSRVRAVYIIVFIATLIYCFRANVASIIDMILIVSLLCTMLFLILQTFILSWRIHCLKQRVCPNFVQYIRGK